MTPIQAVIFDWAGTIVDYGSLAPVRTLQRVFAEAGIEISEAEARIDMGVPKRDHIEAILAARLGHAKGHQIDSLYQQFLPLQLSCLERYSKLIPGAAAMCERLRSHGVKIGSNTGYTRSMLDILIGLAAAQGFSADANCAPEDVGAGRPAPFMIYQLAIRLRVFPMSAILKVGDTPADIAEGLNAGVWTAGVARTGNMIGLGEADFLALPKAEQTMRLKRARHALTSAGAHYVIDSVQDLDSVLNAIEKRTSY